METEFNTLQDLFTDWFYIKDKQWRTLPEFLKFYHLEKILTPRDLSDLMLGKAVFPYSYASLLLAKNPYKLTSDEIDLINRQSGIKNRSARMIEVNRDELKEFKTNLRARKYFSAEERKEGKNALRRERRRQAAKEKKYSVLAQIMQNIAEHKEKHGEEIKRRELPPKPRPKRVWKPVAERKPISPPNPLSKHMIEGRPKRVAMLVPLLEAIANRKETRGEKIDPIELSPEAVLRRKMKTKRRKAYLKTLNEDYKPRKKIKFETEEERLAAKHAAQERFREKKRRAEGREKRVPMSPEEKLEAIRAAKRKHEKKLAKLKAAKVLLPLIDSIGRKLEEEGKIESIPLTPEIIKKRKIKERKKELKELKKNPDFVYERPRKYKTEEERIAARKAYSYKSNNSERHAQWVAANAKKVAAYKKNWDKNNPERAREISRKSKKKRKVKSIIALLRGIAEYKQNQVSAPLSSAALLQKRQREND